MTKSFLDGFSDVFNLEKDNSEVQIADGDDVSSFRKIVEGFQLRDKTFAEKFERFSSFIDEFIAALLRKLQATRDEAFEHTETLKEKLNSLEMYEHEQKNTIAILESDLATLLSACTDATRELQFEVKNNLLELSSLPELEKMKHSLPLGIRESGEGPAEEGQQSFDGSKYVKVADTLLLATRKARALSKQFESTTNFAASTIVDMQNNLKEARTGYGKAIEERDLKQKRVSKLEADVEVLKRSCSELKLMIENLKEAKISYEKAIEEKDLKQNRVSKLEADMEVLQNSCSELRLTLEDYQAKEDKLKEREAEVSSLHNALMMKEQGQHSFFFFFCVF